MPTRIHFNWTDGDSSVWPDCGKLRDGARLSRCSPDSDHVTQFLEKVAVHLVGLFSCSDGESIQIDGLPEGYALFSRSNASGTRHDKYLRGSRYVSQFRSPVEFAPHAAWLLTDPTLDPSNCGCKHCSEKKPGRLQNLGGPSVGIKTPISTSARPNARLFSPPLQDPSASLPKRRYASSLSSNASERSTRRTSENNRIVVRRESRSRGSEFFSAQLTDLTALAEGRLYRDNEVIWYILDEPLRIDVTSRSGKDHTIHLWPGTLKTITRPPLHEKQKAKGEGSTVRYVVTTLSNQWAYIVPQTSIIPLQAFWPDDGFLVELRSMGTDTVDREFNPSPRSSTPKSHASLETVASKSPLVWLVKEIEMARAIAARWTVTDGYYPSLPEPTILTPDPDPQDSHVGRSLVRAGSIGSGGSSVQEYRGLWYGGERVWSGDLLRLSVPARKLKYSNIDPSYFSDDARCDLPSESVGLETCLFLKLSALVPKGARIHVVGHLYKLTPASVPIDRQENLGLPRPLDGFVFKPILSTNLEAQLPLEYVMGRYYPHLISLVDEQLALEQCRLKAMEGYGSVVSVAVLPRRYEPKARETVMDEARCEFLPDL